MKQRAYLCRSKFSKRLNYYTKRNSRVVGKFCSARHLIGCGPNKPGAAIALIHNMKPAVWRRRQLCPLV